MGRLALAGLSVGAVLVLGCGRFPARSARKPAALPAADASGSPRTAPAAEWKGGITGVEVGKRVVRFFASLDPSKTYHVLSTRKGGATWEVEYRIGDRKDRGRRRKVYVSHDGRFMSNALVDVEGELVRHRERKQYIDCLRRHRARVFVDPSEAESKKQIDELKWAAPYVLIDCGGERRELCKRLGYDSLPVFVWGGGAEIGLHGRAWIYTAMGCQ